MQFSIRARPHPAPTLGQWRSICERIGRAVGNDDIAAKKLAERDEIELLERFPRQPISTRQHVVNRLRFLHEYTRYQYGFTALSDEAEAAAKDALLALRRRDPSLERHLRRLADCAEVFDSDCFAAIVAQVLEAMRRDGFLVVRVDAIPRSRHDPKILWVDDAEIVGDRITKVRPIPRNLFTQKTERRIGELGASCVALVVSDVSVHEAP